jgi:hypothetical protein
MENLVQAPSHYVWEVAGKPVSIHLDFTVVDRLAMDVMRGFGAVPKRGAEVGGLLLGSIGLADGKLTVTVEDFVPVVCDYLRGPSYLLTEKDEAKFAEAVEKAKREAEGGQKLVGFYRSHTREALSLADEDLEMFDRYLGDSSQIILLVRPFATRTSTGAFFFQENGGFRRESSYQEFPFKRRDLGGGATTPVRSFSQELTPMPAVTEEGQGPDLREWIKSRGGDTGVKAPRVEKQKSKSAEPPAQFKSKWVWIPLSFVFLVMGIVVGFQSALMMNRGDTQRVSTGSISLGLTAKVESGKVVVRWDRAAAAIQNAASGSLRILDGDFSKIVNLDTRQLQNGSVIYMSAENRVSFRLEVITNQKATISETADFTPGKP